MRTFFFKNITIYDIHIKKNKKRFVLVAMKKILLPLLNDHYMQTAIYLEVIRKFRIVLSSKKCDKLITYFIIHK